MLRFKGWGEFPYDQKWCKISAINRSTSSNLVGGGTIPWLGPGMRNRDMYICCCYVYMHSNYVICIIHTIHIICLRCFRKCINDKLCVCAYHDNQGDIDPPNLTLVGKEDDPPVLLGWSIFRGKLLNFGGGGICYK